MPLLLRRWISAVLVAIATTTITVLTAPAAAHALAFTDTLKNGEKLLLNQRLISRNGLYEARMQANGTFAVYRVLQNDTVNGLWTTAPAKRSNESAFVGNQGDGNLVVYAGSPTGGPVRPLWASGTNGRGPGELVMQNDGNLVLYAAGGPTWSSRTNNTAKPRTDCGGLTIDGMTPAVSPQKPLPPVLDGQRPDAWLHAAGYVESYKAPCNAVVHVWIERKSCGALGCSWLVRAKSPDRVVNPYNKTFTTVSTVCKEGVHSYRTRTIAMYTQVNDGTNFVAKEEVSNVVKIDCTGIGS
ncbi:hypothetical protein GCM10010112_16070 [Actinoplanes lobatus]|uniref:Bulb-type lectin domain-containing protein n=1 Tax=Actinoplanes lobatus TaxID=113568 RepID=A0A7W7MK67_9ACTN|nr:hypothetical protein [Actinoplanes lobatus]MBB4753437.1 hypothetical protein [Actinoplanes lobatus]GGN60141.1 hypothetical protein GCM10010112_16070 [Actinoplanes lobatus]GIE37969.1 hypothetical protein Alo02nite_08670 [Actinoplanes lobatus]